MSLNLVLTIVGLILGILAIRFLDRHRHTWWSYVAILIWFGLVTLFTFSGGAWWEWAIFAVWVWIVYDWRRPMKKKKERAPEEMVLILSDLYLQASLATVALAYHLEQRNDPKLEELCALLTAMSDTIIQLHDHLVSAAIQVTTTEVPNTKEDDR